MDDEIRAKMDRYARQIPLPGIGEEGQGKLREAKTVVIGCGALGTTVANHLCRADLRYLVIADRHYIEPNNLQRQILFNEQDISRELPKAIAAGETLWKISSSIRIKPHVNDVHFRNIEPLIRVADVVVDGTDTLETRYLIGTTYRVSEKTEPYTEN